MAKARIILGSLIALLLMTALLISGCNGTGYAVQDTTSNCKEKNFNFIGDIQRECFIDSECFNGGNPICNSLITYILWECVDGWCQKSDPKEVECCDNCICIDKYGPNSICATSLNNFGNCIISPQVGHYCGDSICEDLYGETSSSCPKDCS